MTTLGCSDYILDVVYKVYTRIGCNNDGWVWKIWFHKVKIQVLEFSKWKLGIWIFWNFLEFFGDYWERLKRFQSLLTALWKSN